MASPAILSFLIISDAYALKQQQTLLAMLNGVMNLSVGAAPVVGSYVTFYFQWQGNFWVLLILSLFTFFITFLCLPKAEKSPPSQPVSALPFSSDTYTPNDCSPVGGVWGYFQVKTSQSSLVAYDPPNCALLDFCRHDAPFVYGSLGRKFEG